MSKRVAALAILLYLALALPSPASALINLDTQLSGGGGGGTIKPQDVIYPSNFEVGRALISSTGLSNVTVSWSDNSPADLSTVIERSVTSAGAWTPLVTFLTPLDGPQSYIDQNLPADSEFCYRVRVAGASMQVVTLPRCVVTQLRGDQGVWRTQLRVRLADVSNAGTDGWVSISLNGGPFDVPHGAWTGINTSIDDFERASDVTYDLIQTGITTLRDITRIQLYTQSTDAFCVRDLQLLVNGALAFEKVFGNTASTCRWVDGSNSLKISHAELRASPQFTGFVSPLPAFTVPREEMVSRLEVLVGSMLWQRTEVHWRDPGPFLIPGPTGQLMPWSPGPAVEVSRKTDNTLHADLHFVANDWPHPDVHIGLDITVSFQTSGSGLALVFETSDFKADVDFPWWVDLIVNGVCNAITLPLGNEYVDCIGAISDYIADQIEKSFDAPSQRVPVALDPRYCVVPAVMVGVDGALVFSCAQARTTTKTFVSPVATKGVLFQ